MFSRYVFEVDLYNRCKKEDTQNLLDTHSLEYLERNIFRV